MIWRSPSSRITWPCGPRWMESAPSKRMRIRDGSAPGASSKSYSRDLAFSVIDDVDAGIDARLTQSGKCVHAAGVPGRSNWSGQPTCRALQNVRSVPCASRPSRVSFSPRSPN